MAKGSPGPVGQQGPCLFLHSLSKCSGVLPTTCQVCSRLRQRSSEWDHPDGQPRPLWRLPSPAVFCAYRVGKPPSLPGSAPAQTFCSPPWSSKKVILSFHAVENESINLLEVFRLHLEPLGY